MCINLHQTLQKLYLTNKEREIELTTLTMGANICFPLKSSSIRIGSSTDLHRSRRLGFGFDKNARARARVHARTILTLRCCVLLICMSASGKFMEVCLCFSNAVALSNLVSMYICVCMNYNV